MEGVEQIKSLRQTIISKEIMGFSLLSDLFLSTTSRLWFVIYTQWTNNRVDLSPEPGFKSLQNTIQNQQAPHHSSSILCKNTIQIKQAAHPFM
jgi:hypothetical protein